MNASHVERTFLKQPEEVFIPPHVVAWWSLCIYLISPHTVGARSSSSPSDPPTASDKTLPMALVAGSREPKDKQNPLRNETLAMDRLNW